MEKVRFVNKSTDYSLFNVIIFESLYKDFKAKIRTECEKRIPSSQTLAQNCCQNEIINE